jgi:hypothetical protein
MTTRADTFAMRAIDTLHATRAARVHALLTRPSKTADGSKRAADPGLQYAVAHHLLEGAELAGRARDHEAFAWYQHVAIDPPVSLYTATAVGQRVIVAPGIDALHSSPISDTPYLVLSSTSLPAADPLARLAVDAFAAADAADFGTLLTGHAAVVCLLRRKALGDTLDSWTISRLPGTIFTDHVADPLVLARDLIHEAGHNWLNDALAALQIKIDDGHTYFSPWKKTERPAFGFLHACWAFPLTMIFVASVLPRADTQVRDYLHAYLRLQAQLLAGTADDHARALTLIPDEDLRGRLEAVFRAALDLAT